MNAKDTVLQEVIKFVGDNPHKANFCERSALGLWWYYAYADKSINIHLHTILPSEIEVKTDRRDKVKYEYDFWTYRKEIKKLKQLIRPVEHQRLIDKNLSQMEKEFTSLQKAKETIKLLSGDR